jgi:hypothetical protein
MEQIPTCGSKRPLAEEAPLEDVIATRSLLTSFVKGHGPRLTQIRTGHPTEENLPAVSGDYEFLPLENEDFTSPDVQLSHEQQVILACERRRESVFFTGSADNPFIPYYVLTLILHMLHLYRHWQVRYSTPAATSCSGSLSFERLH